MTIDLNAPDIIPLDDEFEGMDFESIAPKGPRDRFASGPASPPKDPLLVDINAVALTEPEYLIDGAIETPCTGMVFGASGSGKSFFVLDTSLHIASGRPWLGKAVKEGVVIYLCGEGRHAVPRRVAAWKHVNGDIPGGRFLMSKRRVEFDEQSIRDMVAEIDGLALAAGAPVLVVIDTMARSLPGDADENSAKDVRGFIDACDYIQQRYSCVVLIVHHTGHAEDAKRRARGSSALKGAMDLEILLDNDKGTIEWTKTKDAEPHLPIKYELEKVQYGDGAKANSCVVKYDVTYDSAIDKATKPVKEGVEVLTSLCHKMGTTRIPESLWREEFFEAHGGASAAKRQAFKRAKDGLEKIGRIEILGDTIRVIHSRPNSDQSIEQAMFGHLLDKNRT